jgi:hypothetical protein
MASIQNGLKGHFRVMSKKRYSQNYTQQCGCGLKGHFKVMSNKKILTKLHATM